MITSFDAIVCRPLVRSISLSPRRRRCGERGLRWTVRLRELLLRFRKPRGERLVADDVHRDRHKRVVFAAQLRTLAVVHAFAFCLEPGLIEPAGDLVDFDPERRY